jgi:hypothetical protein
MKLFSIFLFAILFSAGVCAQNVKYFNTNGNAIKGYDAVAYFLQHKAVEGNDSYSYNWNGSLHPKLTWIVLNCRQKSMRRSMVATLRMVAAKITLHLQIPMHLQ